MKQVNGRFILAADSYSPSELPHSRTGKKKKEKKTNHHHHHTHIQTQLFMSYLNLLSSSRKVSQAVLCKREGFAQHAGNKVSYACAGTVTRDQDA